MLINYQIDVIQESKTTQLSGTTSSIDNIPSLIRKAEQEMIKGQKAVVTVKYAQASEEQEKAERERVRKIVKEEFDKMKEKGEI